MGASEKTSEFTEPTLQRREFLSVGGATIAGAAFGGGEGVGVLDLTSPEEMLQEALADVEALTFDVFGTVVDWRTSIIREGQVLGLEKGFDLDCERLRGCLAAGVWAGDESGSYGGAALVEDRSAASDDSG